MNENTMMGPAVLLPGTSLASLPIAIGTFGVLFALQLFSRKGAKPQEIS